MNLNMLKEWLPIMAAVVGLLVGVKLLVANPIEARLSRMETRLNQRLDHIETENQRQHDATRGEINQLRTEMNRRFDTMQTENQRQHDSIEEVLRVFEGRITRLEERTGIGAESAE